MNTNENAVAIGTVRERERERELYFIKNNIFVNNLKDTSVLKKVNRLENKPYLKRKWLINDKKMDRLYLKEKVLLNHSLSFLSACEVMDTKDKYT